MASKLSSLMGNAIRSAAMPSSSSPSSYLIRFTPLRNLSTNTSDTPQPQAEDHTAPAPAPAPAPPSGGGNDTPSVDSSLQNPSTGLVFAKVFGTGKSTLKTDVIHFLEDCNLTPEDIKVEYNRVYNPIGMLLQLPSRSAFDGAIRVAAKKGRLYRLEKVDRSQWDLQESFNGKVVLLQGIPRNAIVEDIERFLSGCNFDGSDIKFLMRPGFPDPIRMALVRFPSRNEAMHAFRIKNRSFCLNNPIMMRVLQ